MEPEEYEIWAEGQASGYDFDQEESELAGATRTGNIERVLELLPDSTEDERLDAFDNLVLYSRGSELSIEDIVRMTVLLLQPGTTTSYLGLVDAIESYSADFLLPVVKYAKKFIPPKDKLRYFRYATVPIVRELLDRVEIMYDPSFWTFWTTLRQNQEVLAYLRDMGKITEEAWAQEHIPELELPEGTGFHSLVEHYL